jgi:hypothetical protein
MRQGAFGYTVSKSDDAELSAQQSDEAIRFPKSFSNSYYFSSKSLHQYCKESPTKETFCLLGANGFPLWGKLAAHRAD